MPTIATISGTISRIQISDGDCHPVAIATFVPSRAAELGINYQLRFDPVPAVPLLGESLIAVGHLAIERWQDPEPKIVIDVRQFSISRTSADLNYCSSHVSIVNASWQNDIIQGVATCGEISFNYTVAKNYITTAIFRAGHAIEVGGKFTADRLGNINLEIESNYSISRNNSDNNFVIEKQNLEEMSLPELKALARSLQIKIIDSDNPRFYIDAIYSVWSSDVE